MGCAMRRVFAAVLPAILFPLLAAGAGPAAAAQQVRLTMLAKPRPMAVSGRAAR